MQQQTMESPKIFSHACLAAIVGGVGMAFAQGLVFAYAPVEEHMKLVQKIFYIHLPMSWWGLFSFLVVFTASIAFLRTRRRKWELLADAAAEVGVVLGALSLATGSIWAKAAWWTWWKWDYRLTTTLVMWLAYAAYLVLRGLDIPRERRAAIKAVAGIVAFLDVPLVFFAARLGDSSHPTGIMSSGDGLEAAMRVAILVSLAAFGFIWFAMLALRHRIAVLEDTCQVIGTLPCGSRSEA